MTVARCVVVVFLMLMLGAVPARANATDSLRCGNELIALGDDAEDVADACGPPAFVDEAQAEKHVQTYQRTFRHGGRDHDHQMEHDAKTDGKPAKGERKDIGRDYRLVNEHSSAVHLEEWTYNFGSGRFIETLSFEDGRLIAIQTGSYGFDEIPKSGALVERGDSKAVVFMKYGPPARKVKRPGSAADVSYHNEGPYLYAVEIERPANEEEWTYNFGPGKFLKRLVFRNNRLVDVHTLPRRGR